MENNIVKGFQTENGIGKYDYGSLANIPDYKTRISEIAISVSSLGAYGDGEHDDSEVFVKALSNYRRVYVPGGTYKLSQDLLIDSNCELELAQDAVLKFEQTAGNCISMKYLASIRGNHSTIIVPYAFKGNVIYISSKLDTNTSTVPPFTKWDPQWKAGRYITDLNITKPDTRGFHYCMKPKVEGDQDSGCNGIAIFLEADGNILENSAQSTFIWGANFSGIRIAGAFQYGIRGITYESASNYNDGWNHDMRIEAFITSCEIGVSLERTNHNFLDVIIQPIAGFTEGADGFDFVYAKHGIELIDTNNTDLSRARVWDWDGAHSLWELNGEYQHLALKGSCSGTILNAFQYYTSPYDIRDLIYSDNQTNLERLVIIQEPITRWFKPIENFPYFNDGYEDKRLLLKSEQDALFQTEQIPQFTNQLPSAINKNGEIFNGIGYSTAGRWDAETEEFEPDTWGTFGCTGLMECTPTSTLHFSNLKWDVHAWNGIILFDENFQKVTWRSAENVMSGKDWHFGYEETESGFNVILHSRAETSTTKYFAINFYTVSMGNNMIVTVDEEIKYTQEGFLADGIYVKSEYVTGIDDKFLKTQQKVTKIDETSTDLQIPTAKSIYDFIQDQLINQEF